MSTNLQFLGNSEVIPRWVTIFKFSIKKRYNFQGFIRAVINPVPCFLFSDLL